jgi:hypothetical protein
MEIYLLESAIYIASPALIIWLLARYWPRFSRVRRLAYTCWLVSLSPVLLGSVPIAMVVLGQGQTIPSGQYIAQGDKPLKISWYDPDLGGINCMAPCDVMATGEKVTEWRYGRTAACIPEWTRQRLTVVIPGLGRFQCLDTGGAIQEHDGYIWIDLLLHEPIIPFGTLIDEWYLEQ